MSRIKWKDEEQLQSHYDKHVLGQNNINESEPEIWKEKHRGNVTKDDYRMISEENICNNHYLCKDKSSNNFSINYCNKYGKNYLLTCTKLKNEWNIYSCYYTDDNHIHPFMNVYYFLNDLKKNNDGEYISLNFTKYEVNNSFDNYYKKVIKEYNLDNPDYSDQEEITLFQLGFLKFFLDNNRRSKINDRTIWINELLYKKINSIILKKEFNLTDEENKQLEKIYVEIEKMKENIEFYHENKDEIDLLIEVNNLINKKHIKFLPNEISRWKMFDSFKKWSTKEK